MGTVVDYCIGTPFLISLVTRFEVDVPLKVVLELKGIESISGKRRSLRS